MPEKKKKKSNGPPKVAAAQAVEPSEEDEFEQLGRGTTYTDVWRLSTRDYLTRSQQLARCFSPTPPSPIASYQTLSAMRTNQKAEEKSEV